MTRFSILASRPKRTLGVLAAVLAAVGVTVASGADFTAQTANPSNTFSSGSLEMSNSKDNLAIFTPSNLIPGGAAQTGTVDIANTGTTDGTFTVRRTDLTNSDAAHPLAAKINLVVKDCGEFAPSAPSCDAGDPTVYSGTLDGFTGDAALGVYSADEQHRYEFAAALDSSADDEYESDDASARFEWNAVQ
jgi:hypothetical protein